MRVYIFALTVFAHQAFGNGLNEALRHDTPTPTVLSHGKRYLHSMELHDALGGVIKFNYDATVHHQVEIIDDWPDIERV